MDAKVSADTEPIYYRLKVVDFGPGYGSKKLAPFYVVREANGYAVAELDTSYNLVRLCTSVSSNKLLVRKEANTLKRAHKGAPK